MRFPFFNSAAPPPSPPVTIGAITTAISGTASAITAAIIVRNLAADLIPTESQLHLLSLLSRQLTITVDEFHGLASNPLFRSVETYLTTITHSSTPSRLRATTASTGEAKDSILTPIEVFLDRGEPITDVFKGVKVTWRFCSKDSQKPVLHRREGRIFLAGNSMPFESRSYQLSFHRKHKTLAIDSYLPFILARAEEIKREKQEVKIFTNEDNGWNSASFNHPATFETMAMKPEAKGILVEDLGRFLGRKDYYRRIGKAWKRGYLLYGPPGTGKSSLVAAMANYLKFDLYYLELAEVSSNAGLRTLMAAMTGRSVLVVEDIDCSVELQQRDGSGRLQESDTGEDKVTLSGLLNFVDGLWSSCSDERIIVFTTNYKDRLDPALLRPGRMDMHIHMSYLCPSGFRTLAYNYLLVEDHPLFAEIDKLIEEVKVTPAEVAEELLRSDDAEAEVALQGLIEFLQLKRNVVVES